MEQRQVEVAGEGLARPRRRLQRRFPLARLLGVADQDDPQEPALRVQLHGPRQVRRRIAALDGLEEAPPGDVGRAVVRRVPKGSHDRPGFLVPVESPQVQRQQVGPQPVVAAVRGPAKHGQGLGAVGEGEGGVAGVGEQRRVLGKEGSPGGGDRAVVTRGAAGQLQQRGGVFGEPSRGVARSQLQERLVGVLASKRVQQPLPAGRRRAGGFLRRRFLRGARLFRLLCRARLGRRQLGQVLLGQREVVKRVELQQRGSGLPGGAMVRRAPACDRQQLERGNAAAVEVHGQLGVAGGLVPISFHGHDLGQPDVGRRTIRRRSGRPTEGIPRVGDPAEGQVQVARQKVRLGVVGVQLKRPEDARQPLFVAGRAQGQLGEPQECLPVPGLTLQRRLEEATGLPVATRPRQLARLERQPVRLRNSLPCVRRGREGAREEARVPVRPVLQVQRLEPHPVGPVRRHVELGGVGGQGREPDRRLVNAALARPHLQRVLHVAEGVDGHRKPIPRPLHVHGAFPGSVGQAPGPFQRKPRLGPAAGRQRIEAGLRDGVDVVGGRVLHEEAPRLELHVLAVRVGQQLLPHAALPGQRPEPHLLARHLLVPRPVSPAPSLVVVVAAEEVVQLPDDVVRLVASEGVVPVQGQVAARFVHRPRPLPARVLQVRPTGHEELQVVACERRRRHPAVVGLLQRRRVVPQDAGLEVGPVRRQTHLDPPVRSRRQVHRSHEDAGAAVVVLPSRPLHGGRGRRRVADDAEVELDPARRPRTPERDVAELHHLVAVDELPPGLLDHRAPHLPARLGQDEDPDQVVLERRHAPLPGLRGRGVPVEGVVGVEPSVPDEHGHGVRVREGVGVERPHFLEHEGSPPVLRAGVRGRRACGGNGEERERRTAPRRHVDPP